MMLLPLKSKYCKLFPEQQPKQEDGCIIYANRWRSPLTSRCKTGGRYERVFRHC
jgi:hypothetical protein